MSTLCPNYIHTGAHYVRNKMYRGTLCMEGSRVDDMLSVRRKKSSFRSKDKHVHIVFTLQQSDMAKIQDPSSLLFFLCY